MRRVFAVLATTSILLAGGCGSKSYEKRLGLTLEEMQYRARLDKNLMPAPSKGKFIENMIFVRPPKSLGEPTKEFLMTVVEAGKFDVTESFVEKDKQNLYVIARVKKPKNPAGKKAAPKPAEVTVARGDFNSDVISLLNGVYGVELEGAKAKEESKRLNKFKHLSFESNGKDVQVYLYGGKTSPYEVALIFEYPKSEAKALVSKIDLTLGSFAVGEFAKRSFSGSVNPEESTEGSTPAGPVAF